jgi:hypothetical protein
VYNKFDGFKADDTLGQFLDAGRVPFEVLKFLIGTVGFHIGRGPSFGKSAARKIRYDSLARLRPLTREMEGCEKRL